MVPYVAKSWRMVSASMADGRLETYSLQLVGSAASSSSAHRV
jgi:hypothetical protein